MAGMTGDADAADSITSNATYAPRKLDFAPFKPRNGRIVANAEPIETCLPCAMSSLLGRVRHRHSMQAMAVAARLNRVFPYVLGVLP
jgi:hypothetical protein